MNEAPWRDLIFKIALKKIPSNVKVYQIVFQGMMMIYIQCLACAEKERVAM